MRKLSAFIREFGSRLISHIYSLVVGVVGGILGIVDAVSAAVATPKTNPFSIPLWLWLPMLGVGFILAVCLASRDVYRKWKIRNDIRRHALRVDNVSVNGRSDPAGTVNVELGLLLKNHSDENIQYAVEEASAAIEGKSAVAHNPGALTAIIPPDETSNFRFPPVRGLPPEWKGKGTLSLTTRYGPTSSPQDRYRVCWEYELRFSRLDGQNIQVDATPVRDTKIENI